MEEEFGLARGCGADSGTRGMFEANFREDRSQKMHFCLKMNEYLKTRLIRSETSDFKSINRKNFVSKGNGVGGLV